MPLFQVKIIKDAVKLFSFFLAVFIVVGCSAQKTENLQTAEQEVMDQGASDKIALDDRQITAVSLDLQDKIIEITIQGNQKLTYTSIKQSFPFGIAIYFPETRIADNFKTAIPENKMISDLIVNYADEEKTTVKIEILLREDCNYEVIENDTALKMALLRGMEKNISGLNKIPEQLPIDAGEKKQENFISEKNIIIPDKAATMTNIEFNTMEDGKSDIVVETTHPVKYDITPDGNDKLYLNLYNTIIPDHHKRPFLTQYFKSAVESLLPVQVPGKKKNAKIEIKIRNRVPYRVVQDQNNISIFFDPSSVEPPVFNKSTKKLVSGTQKQSIETALRGADLKEEQPTVVNRDILREREMTGLKERYVDSKYFGFKDKFTGEKIGLDFYKTDIRNVFRILRSVGKFNIAIDKNVEGKVTLTLEQPIPWDEVLYLILKMNNIGMKKEGDIIRIATLQTLKTEELVMQEAILAENARLKAELSFEPSITEYFPLSYASAEKISAHLTAILTSDKGQVSVAEHVNMVIMTDTASKIEQAREIIRKLDLVTSQIMIEAKVVEVTKNFSRELGVGLSFTERYIPTAGVSDFTVALNHPISKPGNTGSFNFFRLFGSSLTALNAEIAAAEVKGEVKVVSSPRILTLDNKMATIKQGLEFAYLERDDTGGSSVKFKNIDLLLKVTPHVTHDKRVAMQIFLTKNDIDSITNGIPSLSTNVAETELLVDNNDTIVIGGIVKTTDNKSVAGVPILSGIPILGRLFRTDRDTDNRNELLIFITPSIVQLEQKRNTAAPIN